MVSAAAGRSPHIFFLLRALFWIKTTEIQEQWLKQKPGKIPIVGPPALNRWAWVEERVDIRPQGTPFPKNTLSSVKTITKPYSGWGGVFEMVVLLASKGAEVCRRCLTLHILHSSSLLPALPVSLAAILGWVKLPSKSDEHLGLNADILHPEALKLNRFSPYVLCSFCGIFYSCKQSCYYVWMHHAVAMRFPLYWKTALKIIENLVCCIFCSSHN